MPVGQCDRLLWKGLVGCCSGLPLAIRPEIASKITAISPFYIIIMLGGSKRPTNSIIFPSVPVQSSTSGPSSIILFSHTSRRIGPKSSYNKHTHLAYSARAHCTPSFLAYLTFPPPLRILHLLFFFPPNSD